MKPFAPIPEEAERVASALLGAAIEVHRLLGPGFLERIYEEALCHELTLRDTSFERQKPIQVLYKDVPVGEQRLDLLVGGFVIFTTGHFFILPRISRIGTKKVSGFSR